MKNTLIGYIDFDKEKNKAFMPIFWDEIMDINFWKGKFNSQYGDRITWII